MGRTISREVIEEQAYADSNDKERLEDNKKRSAAVICEILLHVLISIRDRGERGRSKRTARAEKRSEQHSKKDDGCCGSIIKVVKFLP